MRYLSVDAGCPVMTVVVEGREHFITLTVYVEGLRGRPTQSFFEGFLCKYKKMLIGILRLIKIISPFNTAVLIFFSHDANRKDKQNERRLTASQRPALLVTLSRSVTWGGSSRPLVFM
jgi:hypothetical protein